MNKLANVLYAYSPKNDDELELKVGDKIEVIGFEEEGWWKGRLKNRIGVFPSNFVQVIEAGSPNTAQPLVPGTPTYAASQTNKLNLFSNKTSKTSLSATSLNSSNSNNNNSNNINNNSMMNNTQDSPGEDSSERRLKPIRGVGYGDIFTSGVKPKPLVGDERLSTGLTATLQKQIPKKPPPPTPAMDVNNGTSNEQAPALPPKPATQYNNLQHQRSLSPAQQQHPPMQQVREQAKVIFAYDPANDDELAMKVGDIIDVLDKNIEDAGWWKGELRGKVGVFPDNFVQLIEVPATPNFIQQPSTNEAKSVFASTPKGFSKQLEKNLEKHNSPASFLSLKRNKLQQQTSLTGEPPMEENGGKEGDGMESQEMNTTKLNHITANRAKGPSRRPPSNILLKRNQIDQVKRESNGKDDHSLGSLPATTTPQPILNDSLSSLPSAPAAPIKPSLSLDNVIENQAQTPKTSQRITQVNAIDRNKIPATPPWMVELKKTHAEKKRDSPVVATTHEELPKVDQEINPAKSVDRAPVDQAPVLNSAQYESLVRQISKNVASEFKEEMKRLQEEMEVMKVELKACQSATENQKRYIKELVSNLADERKKIAAMQVEIDRTLK